MSVFAAPDTALRYHTEQTHCRSEKVTKTLGMEGRVHILLPPRALLIRIFSDVQTAFTGATKIQVGTTEKGTDLGEVNISATGRQELDLAQKKVHMSEDHSTPLYISFDQAATAGVGTFTVSFCVRQGTEKI